MTGTSIDTMKTGNYCWAVRPGRILIAICVVLAAWIWLPRAEAQTPRQRLTDSGDVLEFEWAPQGDALYLTRAGQVVDRSARVQQVTGDLYRVALDGQEQLLAPRANELAVSPSGGALAFVRLADDGSARLVQYDLARQSEQEVAQVSWGVKPQWNRSGDALLYASGGAVTAARRGTQVNLFPG